MNLQKMRMNAKGFSLVELMIVVAIIGILSAVAVPNFQRFQRKSRQAEAKGNLAAYYSAEKSAQAEWNAYLGNYAAIGFRPDGVLNYRMATVQNAQTATINNGGTPPGYVAGCTVTSAACAGFISWTEMNGGAVGSPTTIGVAAAVVPTTTDTNTFTGSASGWIGGGNADTWCIHENKNLLNNGGALNGCTGVSGVN